MTRAMLRSFCTVAGLTPLFLGVVLSTSAPLVATPETLTENTVSTPTSSILMTDAELIAKYLPSFTPINTIAAVRTTGSLPTNLERISFDKQSMLSVVKSEQLQALRERADLEFFGHAFSSKQSFHILTDTILVRFAEGVSQNDKTTLLSSHGFTIARENHGITYATFSGKNGLHILEHTNQLRSNPLVKLCMADWITKYEKTNYTGEFGNKDFGGTSGAAAIAAGVAGLTWNANPTLDPFQIIDILRETANPGSGAFTTPDTTEDTTFSTYIKDFDATAENGWKTYESVVQLSSGYDVPQGQARFNPVTRTVNHSALFGDGVIDPVGAVIEAFARANSDETVTVNGFDGFLPNPSNDPLFQFQWYMNNNQNIFQENVSQLSSLNVSGNGGAWQQYLNNNTTGASLNPAITPIRYIVIDDGIAVNHPEINLVGQYDVDTFLVNSTTAQPRSGTSHGTSVAGILAARDNSTGIVGITPGFPVIGIRVVNTEGRRGNSSFTRVSRVLDAILIAGDIAASNPNNRHIVVGSFYSFVNDPSLASVDSLGAGGFFEFAIEVLAEGSSANNFRDGILFVFPTGNGNDRSWSPELSADNATIAARDLFNQIGAQEAQPIPFRQSALIVSAVNSRAIRGADSGDPNYRSKASYSNFGPGTSLCAPSGDDLRSTNIINPGAPVQISNSLQLVTTGTNLLNLGGESLLPYDILENYLVQNLHEIPSASVVGIANWNTFFSNLFTNPKFTSEDNQVLFLGDGFTATVEATDSIINIIPNVTQTPNGELFGSALVQVFDSNELLVSSFTIQNVTGRFKYARTGSYKKKERITSTFTLKGKDIAGNQFSITGSQKAVIVDGILKGGTAPATGSLLYAPKSSSPAQLGNIAQAGLGIPAPDPTGTPRPVVPSSFRYVVKGSINVAGIAKVRFNGFIYPSTVNGTKPGEVTDLGGSTNYALGTFYSPQIAQTKEVGATRVLYSGPATVDTFYGYIPGVAGDVRNVISAKIDFSTPAKLGRYSATARQGVYSSRSEGYHAASTNQKSAGVEIPTVTSYPTRVNFRSPAANTTLVNTFTFGQYVGD